MPEFSDFIVYADESGDHGMVSIDPEYPVFALTFCVMRKADYSGTVVPAVQSFKFGIWGHDAVILHEHEIRKSKGPFAILMTDRALRERFYDVLNGLIEAAPMTIFASVIDKEKLRPNMPLLGILTRSRCCSAWSGCTGCSPLKTSTARPCT